MNDKKNFLNILVVEDNLGDYLLLKEYLQLGQLLLNNIFHAEKMMMVPALIKDKEFDIALLDLTLPDSTGIDSVITLERLLPQTPIVVFSGMTSVELAMEAISLGAQDYLVKGEFDEKMLAKSIQYSIERKKTLQRLEASNIRYDYINRATHDIIWEWNLETNVITRNKAISDVMGYREEEVDDSYNWWKEHIHPDDRERVSRKIDYCIGNKIQTWQEEYRFRTADGSYKFIFDRAYILFTPEGKPYHMIGAMMDMTETRKLEQELLAQQLREQKIITEASIQGQEKEKNELGKELHDNINQILATVKMYLGIVINRRNEPEELIEKSHGYVIDAIEAIRKLSKTLVAPSLGDIGLREALEELLEEINISKKWKIDLLYEIDNEQVIGNDIKLMLFRIVQEQLNNILKYAKAEKITIHLKIDPENIYLAIADNGIGFDVKAKAKGIGLRNISNRVEFYSGSMDIISSAGNGCILEITVPVNTKNNLRKELLSQK